ncbi:MAG: hypothetical protein RL410_378 [Actinomycetota bacterium]
MKFAQVIVDVAPLHLDHPFTYAIPEEFSSRVFVGSRVRVIFHGRKLIAYVVDITNDSPHKDRISPIYDVLCDQPVLTPEVAALTKSISQRWIGSWVDVIKASIPPRHAKTEESVFAQLPMPSAVDLSGYASSEAWNHYSPGVFEGLAAHSQFSAALVAAPGDDLQKLGLDVAVTAIRRNKVALILVPDLKSLKRLHKLVLMHVPKDAVAVLSSEDGPGPRYRNFLRVLRGEVSLVIGTRAAVLAPISSLGVIVVLDDTDNSYSELRNPAWNAREVALMRRESAACQLFIASHSRTTEVQRLVESGNVIDVVPDRDYVRLHQPRIRATSAEDLARDPLAKVVRLPSQAFTAIRDGLKTGPVLIQVPRRGYQLRLSCARCRESVRCTQCEGPMSRAQQSGPMSCTRCGAVTAIFSCQWCQSTEVRSGQLGAVRTAEEFGRAFPDTVIRTSGKDNILDEIDLSPALVIATPGAAPVVKDGYYSAAVILDADATLMYSYLTAHEDTFHRWCDVAALVAPQTGTVIVAGDDSHHVISAFTSLDTIGFASKELAIRKAASMLPANNVIEIHAPLGTWSSFDVPLPPTAKVFGPVAIQRGQEKCERVLISTPWAEAELSAKAIRANAIKTWLARGSIGMEIDVDPAMLF